MMHNGSDENLQPKVPTERPDPAVADSGPEASAQDRPGFDLGGSTQQEDPTTGTTIPGGPRTDPARGGSATGRAGGLTDVSGSRSLGNDGDSGSAAGGGPTDGSGGPS